MKKFCELICSATTLLLQGSVILFLLVPKVEAWMVTSNPSPDNDVACAITKEYKPAQSPEVIEEGEKGDQLQVYCQQVRIVNSPVLCNTIVVWSTLPFDEMTITWNNKPPLFNKLAEYSSTSRGWYTFASTALDNYIDSLEGDTIPFCLEIKDRNGGVCDIVWYFGTKEAGASQTPKLIHNGTPYLSIGDAWVTDGYPGGPTSNYGRDPEMFVCSCTLTCLSGTPPDCDGGHYRSGTQFAYVEFYIPPAGIDEDTKKSEFIFEVNPNPFSAFTRISYTVPNNEEKVSLMVFNVMGELVRTLVNEIKPAGRYEVMWDGKDEKGVKLPSGYYFYKLNVGDKKLTAKSLLLKL